MWCLATWTGIKIGTDSFLVCSLTSTKPTPIMPTPLLSSHHPPRLRRSGFPSSLLPRPPFIHARASFSPSTSCICIHIVCHLRLSPLPLSSSPPHLRHTIPTETTANAPHSVLGIFWKFARVGERLSPYISICCVVMAVSIPELLR